MSDAQNPLDHSNDIAVIGFACRFPGAQNAEEYWGNLRGGIESIAFLSRDELAAVGVPATVLANPNYVPAQAVITGADQFDAQFFGYSPREAQFIDPQQRVFLECAWAALEHAGCDASTYDGAVGVY